MVSAKWIRMKFTPSWGIKNSVLKINMIQTDWSFFNCKSQLVFNWQMWLIYFWKVNKAQIREKFVELLRKKIRICSCSFFIFRKWLKVRCNNTKCCCFAHSSDGTSISTVVKVLCSFNWAMHSHSFIKGPSHNKLALT